jgi:hypothetical protein
MPNVDRECITHHYACDCREEKFRKLESENNRMKELLCEVLPFMSNIYDIFSKPVYWLSINTGNMEAIERWINNTKEALERK